MDVFDLDRAVMGDYKNFARSFTCILAPDLKERVDQIYQDGTFWRDPYISLNPGFEAGESLAALIAGKQLHPQTGQIFRDDGQPLNLYRHQTEAVVKAARRQSYVVTTGTGSGKSLCFFIPIIDAAIRARLAGEALRTRAIIIYPMNALANSQFKEIKDFIEQADLPEDLRPTFDLYTGQEDNHKRDATRVRKPDILLTNFMMLELLMTRQSERDRAVIENAQGLDFIVLDELHTYRGRQGADVAMLVRRLKDRLCADREPICIGTSATMAGGGADAGSPAAVASIASRLFGTSIGPDGVIGESLKRATDPEVKLNHLGAALKAAIDGGIPDRLSDEGLRRHPLAIWIELEIGLLEGQSLTRRKPVTLKNAASRLAEATGRASDRCEAVLRDMLVLMSLPGTARGGSGTRAFMAFKLHRFISGAGQLYVTLHKPGLRRATANGQVFDPDEPNARLYPTYFCRECGQDYHLATKDPDNHHRFIARSIDDAPMNADAADQPAGYLLMQGEPGQIGFDGTPETYPEDWLDSSGRIKPSLRAARPLELRVDTDGAIGQGHHAWFIPGKFRFCLRCLHQPPSQAREINKLAGLAAEGRSSATTLLTSSVLRWMDRPDSKIPEAKRKLLAFTDNRQDAALQAGNFNDFLFVSLLRAAILQAVRSAGPEGIGEAEFGRQTQRALGFTAENVDRRIEWMGNPDLKGVGRTDAERCLAQVLTYRTWIDQRRGWRFTNPSLEDLGLIHARYISLDELAQDQSAFESAPAILQHASAGTRAEALRILLDHLRTGLAIATDVLAPASIDMLAVESGNRLRDPWSLEKSKDLHSLSTLMLAPPSKAETKQREEALILRGGPQSGLARKLRREKLWNIRLDTKTYKEMLLALLKAAASYGLVQRIDTFFDTEGWRLNPSAIRLVGMPQTETQSRKNAYFINLYEILAADLATGGPALFGFDGRAHTAQIDQTMRIWRERRFRWEEDDRQNILKDRDTMRAAREPDRRLPVLFCSPTMELGVDISAMNMVYHRNVPPTPANYAQRAGRAGRSGQAALVLTYCAAQSPHDQYYFADPARMVSGIVRPPSLDLANRDLIEAHLHAIWLAETEQALDYAIPGVLDLKQPGLPLQAEIATTIARDEVTRRATARMERVLARAAGALTPEAAPWAQDRAAFARAIALDAERRFNAAFTRWRDLYAVAQDDLRDANRRSEMTGLSAKERRTASSMQKNATDQLAVLERDSNSAGGEFQTYRYLATEGFLPGYNFPRLPLYAFIPGDPSGGPRAAYLQRARFLAIAEFGPGSLIYHEGRTYRVDRARLSANARNSDTGMLNTDIFYLCAHCGAGHEKLEPERCHACGADRASIKPVRNVFRINSVSTQQAARITANDEDRRRQGFEIQTSFAWPKRNHSIDVHPAIAADAGGPILNLDYATGATISRLNKGLRRRKYKEQLGFGIDAASGIWVSGGFDETGEAEQDPDATVKQRIVPIVQDSKNTALFRLSGPAASATTMATLQYALARGLDLIFQVEEGEIQTEPLPTRADRHTILAYEATEGGAGALHRLITEPDALARVANQALTLMHFHDVGAAIKTADPGLLRDEPGTACIKGCYRCLLSYYNQMDHQIINRQDPEALTLLLRLARAAVSPRMTHPVSPATPWSEACAQWNLPEPAGPALHFAGAPFPLHWPEHLIAAAPGLAIQDAAHDDAATRGYTLVALPETPGDAPPAELATLLSETP